jgi:hypothetical protein
VLAFASTNSAAMSDHEHIIQVQAYPQDEFLVVELLRQGILAFLILADASKLPYPRVTPTDLSGNV